jgi:hypothetical protein
VDVWLADPATRLGQHYFHSPRSMFTGTREEPLFESADPSAREALGRARAADWGTAAVTVSPYGYRGGPRTGANVSHSAFGSLADELLAFARERGASHVLSHYLIEEENDAWIRALAERGGSPVVMGADAVLDIRWGHMDEYHAWLGTSRRSLHGRAARGEPDIEWSTRSEPGLAQRQLAVPELLERHAAQFDPVGHPPARLLRAVAGGESFPRILLTAAEHGAAPRSALAAIDYNGALYPKFFGAAKPRTDYFPLVYTHLIAYAIANGRSRIEYGGGSHRAKLFRGARLRPLLGVLFVLDSRLRDRVLPLVGLLSAAKLEHFSALAERWHIDHLPLDTPSSLDLQRSTAANV